MTGETETIKKINKWLSGQFAVSLMMLVIFALAYILLQPKATTLDVNFLDIGQGDATLISTPQNQLVLIDGGPNGSVVSEIDKKVPVYHHSIDAIILTHPHADHLVGLLDVIKKYEVKNIYMTGVLHTIPEYIDFLSLVKEKQIPVKIVQAGDSLDLGDETKIEFLFPLENLSGKKVDNLNDSSIVAKLSYGENDVLFMGDLENESQDVLLKKGNDFFAEIIKVAHHGSAGALNKEFLDKVNAKYAVVSAGKDNKFGHPSPKVLNYFSNARLYRTDQDGTVTFRLTKTDIAVEKP